MPSTHRNSSCSSRTVALPLSQKSSLVTDRTLGAMTPFICQLLEHYSPFPSERRSPAFGVSYIFKAVSWNVQWEPSETQCSGTSLPVSLSAVFPQSKYFTRSIQEEIFLFFPSDRFHRERRGQLARQSLSWFWWVSGSSTLLTCPHTSPQYWQSCHQGWMDQSKEETLNRNSISKNLLD